MFFKVLSVLAIGACAYAGHQAQSWQNVNNYVEHSQPIKVETKDYHGHHQYHVDYVHPPHYEFKYGVEDPHTDDNKEQKESRLGDKVEGQYSLHEADGTIRTVKYTADKHNGFNAIVHREGHAIHPQHYKTESKGHEISLGGYGQSSGGYGQSSGGYGQSSGGQGGSYGGSGLSFGHGISLGSSGSGGQSYGYGKAESYNNVNNYVEHSQPIKVEVQGKHGHHEYHIDYVHPAHYEFKYGVKDPHTKDNKEQKESRLGDKVDGQYSFHEADGTIRTVKYTADKENGFNAIVHREGHAIHPQHYKTESHGY